MAANTSANWASYLRAISAIFFASSSWSNIHLLISTKARMISMFTRSAGDDEHGEHGEDATLLGASTVASCRPRWADGSRHCLGRRLPT